MIVEGQFVEIKCKKMTQYYLDKGYLLDEDDRLIVRAEDLSAGSGIKILVQCDYCGEQYYMSNGYYQSGILKGLVKKCACHNCAYEKVKEVNMIRYGVEHTAVLPSVREKYKKTCIEKYGVENINQLESIKEKKKKHFLDVYGVENPFQDEGIKNKNAKIMIEKYGKSNPMMVEELVQKQRNSIEYYNGKAISKEQKRLAALFNGELNVKIGKYWADILLSDNIILEYDGKGHDMHVVLGRVSAEDFKESEIKRTEFMLNSHYKIIRFVHKKNTHINDKKYIEIFNLCKSQFSEKHRYIEYDFDTDSFSMSLS